MNPAAAAITIRGSSVSLKDIRSIELAGLTPNEKKAVEFCLEWLNGKSSFDITTSGSTGTPKKIVAEREAMMASAERTAKALGLRAGMTCLVCLDTGFIAGMMMLVRGMTVGMNMIITEPSANPLKDILPSSIDFTALVPYQVSTMLRSDERTRVASIGTIILGGANVSAELQRDLSDLPASCYATFGMTETLSHIALQKLNGKDLQESFHTLEGISIRQDDRSCLVIAADYLKETIVTNDIVEIINEKEFRWLGRFDNLINTGGIKVLPEKIEKLVETWMLSKSVSNRSFVTALSHPALGQEVALIIEGSLSKEDEHTLLSSLRISLSKYEMPRRVFYKDHFIETKTGKIDRRATLS